MTARPDLRGDRASRRPARHHRGGTAAAARGGRGDGNGRTARRVVLRELPLAPGGPLDAEALEQAASPALRPGSLPRSALPAPAAGRGRGPAGRRRRRARAPDGLRRLRAGLLHRRALPRLRRGRRAEPLRDGPRPALEEQGQRAGVSATTCSTRSLRLFAGSTRARPTSTTRSGRSETGYDLLRRGVTLGVNRELTARLLLNVRYRYEFVDYSNVAPDLTAELGPLESANIGSVSRRSPRPARQSALAAARSLPSRERRGRASALRRRRLVHEVRARDPRGICRSAGGRSWRSGLRGGFTQLLSAPASCRSRSASSSAATTAVRGYAYKDIGRQGRGRQPARGRRLRPGQRRAALHAPREAARRALPGHRRALGRPVGAPLPSSGVKTSVGAGLRYETLVGPIRLDWGYKLAPEPGRVALALAPHHRVPF